MTEPDYHRVPVELPALTPDELQAMASDPNTTAGEREAIEELLCAILRHLASQDGQA